MPVSPTMARTASSSVARRLQHLGHDDLQLLLAADERPLLVRPSPGVPVSSSTA